jgi:CO/xanthine dehydrogenase Mo-binding subunit
VAPRVPPPLADAPHLSDWVRIDDAGRIAFLSGRVELGQGVVTALRQMAADELGVLPDEIAVETARTDRTPNEGFTAGSVSISFGGQSLRWAASALRRLILEAAAARLAAPVEALDFGGGEVLCRGEPTGLAVADLVRGLDIAVPVADIACPKPASERWQRFRDIPRTDLRDRLVGAPFVHDMTAPGMLHGAPVHPPHMDWPLLALDLDTLRARPGVVEVVRDGSFVGILAESPRAAARAAEWARANGVWGGERREVGDPVAVIAQSEAEATIVAETGETNRNDGRWFATTVTRPFIFHGSIGPAAAVAIWDGDEVTVWTHSQGVFQLRTAMSQALDIAEDRIRAIHHPGAGCYGHNGADDAAFDAVLMARAVPGRPVKVVWSRADEFRAAPMGPGMATTAKALLGPDNRVRAMDVTVNSAPHANRPSSNGTPNLRAAAYLARPLPPARSTDLPLVRGGGADRNAVPGYAIPNVRVRKRLVHDLPYRTSSLRSLGAFTNVLAIETLLDDIAIELDETPFAFRLRHLEDPRARVLLEWLEAETRDARAAPLPEGAGWGLGYARYKGIGGYCAVLARVTVGDDVRVTDVVCAADIGEAVSPDGARNQIEGGIVQSISWTLKEQVRFDGAAVATESWLDYPILRFSEVPRVSVHLIERPEEAPLGAGEISQGPTAAAVANAVRAAVGVRVTGLPITREAVIAALSA